MLQTFILGYPGNQKRSLRHQIGVRYLIQQITENGLRYTRGPAHFSNHPLHICFTLKKSNQSHFGLLKFSIK